jgi:protein gp37
VGKGTAIEWAHHTFNPWEGCQKVGPGCDHCYAEVRNARFGGGVATNWGPGAPRRRTSPGNWRQPLKWNREAANDNTRYRVFCASLADWADNAVPDQWRADLAQLIRDTPYLDWLLLTKRIGNANAMLRAMFPEGVPANVWLGITVVNQKEADRDIPVAIVVKEALQLSVLFLSVEPLLGPLKLRRHLMAGRYPGECASCGKGHGFTRCPNYGGISNWHSLYRDGPVTCEQFVRKSFAVDWVIVGGESGDGARPMHPEWVYDLRDQCAATFVPFLFKQWGEFAPSDLGRERRLVAVDLDGQYARSVGILEGDQALMAHVGKKAAGRLLVGQEHNGLPRAA